MLKHLAEDTGQGDRTIVGWVRFIPFFGASSLWRVCRTIGLVVRVEMYSRAIFVLKLISLLSMIVCVLLL